MRSHKNVVVVASAGGRKTTDLVDYAIATRTGRTLLTTYTNENLDQIRRMLQSKCGCIPAGVELMTWYGFLMRECARPYQRARIPDGGISEIEFGPTPEAARYVAKSSPQRYYLSPSRRVYQDRVAELICDIDDATGGSVIQRLQRVFSSVLVDEVQDLNGWDLDLLVRLLKSRIPITCVGDPRQATFQTNNSPKNKQYRGAAIHSWLRRMATAGHLAIEERTECYRANQAICDFADQLYPSMPRTTSMNVVVTGHDGVFHIRRSDVAEYVTTYKPMVLRYDRRMNTMDLTALNFGASKGRTFPRVLIFPTKPIKTYLETGDLSKAGDVSKLYVAVTRAQNSVAFVID